MPEESRSLAHLGPESLVELPEPARAKLLPDPEVPVVDLLVAGELAYDGSFDGVGSLDREFLTRSVSVTIC